MVWWKPTTWVFDPKWPIISAMPTVQVRMLFLCMLDAGTFLMVWHWGESILHSNAASKNADPMVWELFGSWLAFLSGAHGFSLAAYNTKRKTSWDGNVEEDRAGDSTRDDSATVDPSTINPATGQGVPSQTAEMRIPDGAPPQPTAPTPPASSASAMPLLTRSDVLGMSGSFAAPPPPPPPKLIADD